MNEPCAARAVPVRSHVLLCGTLLVVSMVAPAVGECPGNWLVDPEAPGENGQTFVGNFYTLLADLTHQPTAPSEQVALDRLTINGETYLTVPWFSSSTECTQPLLQRSVSGNVVVDDPSLADGTANYLIVTDELSELAWVIALGTDEALMQQIDRTVRVMTSSEYTGLPCWVAEVEEDAVPPITCVSQDTATDGTVRLGLAYYNAANNPYFSPGARSYFRGRGDAIAAHHLEVEYRHETHTSAVTGRTMAHWVAGGANTAKPGHGFEMFIGYYPDVALLLLAAGVSTGDPAYHDRAADVVDQFLSASSFDGTTLSLGPMKFRWAHDAAGDLRAEALNAWEASDAPRALWMGHVLRARDLATGGAPLSGPYGDLSTWVQLLLATDTQTPTHSCIEYAPDGTPNTANCGDNYYYHGLAMGLITFENLSWLRTKLEDTLPSYAWGEAGKYWDWTPCFGIYRPIRPLKALAAALGLDAATYGGRRPRSCVLDIARVGSGSGWIESQPAGIECGAICAAIFPENGSAPVVLSTTAYQGSSFEGWTEASCAGGSVLVVADTTCTATFDGTCDPVVDLQAQTVGGSATFAGCQELRAGNGFQVAAGGEVTFLAGDRIVLYDGFSVAAGASFSARAGLEP